MSPLLAPPRPRRQTTARQSSTRGTARRPPAWSTFRALFAEARRRRRWRRLAGAAVSLALVTGATAFAVTW